MVPTQPMSHYQQLRQQIEDDYKEALGHLAWLEAYEKRMPMNGQQVMEPIERAAKSMPVAPAAPRGATVNQSALIDEAIANARGEFSANEVLSFIRARHPELNPSRKYISFSLYKKAKAGGVRLARKGLAGNPNYYAKNSPVEKVTMDDPAFK